MITYNPKDWWKLIFAFHKSDTFRMLLPGMLALAVFTAGIAYLELDHLHLTFKNSMAAHSIIGFVLSFLLVFRTNSAYDRWWEGRKLWGSFVNNSRNLAMKLNALLPKERTDLREMFRILIGNYVTAAHQHLLHGVDFKTLENYGKFDEKYYRQFNHIPNGIAKTVYEEIIKLNRNGIFTKEDILFLNAEIQSFTDNIGACERIKNTPIPYSYSIFLKKIIFVYVLTMPFGFAMEFGYWAALVVPFVFYAFASIELIGEEIENPFGDDANDLPTDEIAERIKGNLKELL